MIARAPLLLLALLIAGPLAAATLTVPAVRDGTGAAVSGRLSVVLVDASGRPVVAANNTGLATAASLAALTEDVTLTLAPTTALAAPGGGPVFYRVRIDAGQARLDQTITLPDGAADLPDLLPPGSVWARDATLAQILLPSAPAGAAAGWGLILSGTPLAPAWSAAAGGGGCSTLACLLDGPAGYGTAGQVATSTGAGWQWSAAGGAVTSVAGRTGAVTLSVADISGLATVATTGAYSDLTGRPTLGTAAATASTDYATAAQGALAATAVQPGALATVATTGAYSDLTGRPTLGTAAATASTDYATEAQGALAATAVQPGALATVATTGAYSDLSGRPTLGTAAALSATPTAGECATWSAGGALIGAGSACGTSSGAVWGSITGTISAQTDLTPAAIGAEPAGVAAADITDGTAVGRALLTATTAAAQRTALALPLTWPIVLAGPTTDISTSTTRTVRMPEAMSLSSVVCDVAVAPTGSAVTIATETDSGSGFASIWSTRPAIATSTTATDASGSTAGTLSTSPTSLPARQPVRLSVHAADTGDTARGLVCTLIGVAP